MGGIDEPAVSARRSGAGAGSLLVALSRSRRASESTCCDTSFRSESSFPSSMTFNTTVGSLGWGTPDSTSTMSSNGPAPLYRANSPSTVTGSVSPGLGAHGTPVRGAGPPRGSPASHPPLSSNTPGFGFNPNDFRSSFRTISRSARGPCSAVAFVTSMTFGEAPRIAPPTSARFRELRTGSVFHDVRPSAPGSMISAKSIGISFPLGSRPPPENGSIPSPIWWSTSPPTVPLNVLKMPPMKLPGKWATILRYCSFAVEPPGSGSSGLNPRF